MTTPQRHASHPYLPPSRNAQRSKLSSELRAEPVPTGSRARATKRLKGANYAFALLVTASLGWQAGCVRRTLTITTDPPQALVYLNDQEVGRSTVTRDFLWYGDYDVIVRKEGFETLSTHWQVQAPWYQVTPFDFFAEVLWPAQLHDQHEAHFVLEPRQLPEPADLIDRAEALRERAARRGS